MASENQTPIDPPPPPPPLTDQLHAIASNTRIMYMVALLLFQHKLSDLFTSNHKET